MNDDRSSASFPHLETVYRLAAADPSGSSKPWESQLLYALARAGGYTDLLEVCCHIGMTTTWLATAAQQNGGSLIAIDFNQKSLCTAMARLEEFNLLGVTEFLLGEAAALINAMPPDRAFDFVYLDADHHIENFEPIFEAVWPRVKTGGLLCVHDIDFVDADEREWFPKTFPHGIRLTAMYGDYFTLPTGVGIVQKPRDDLQPGVSR